MIFIESLIVGFVMAAPVGPVGVLCIRRALRFGWLAGFVTGLGVAFADALYGSVASFGLTSVSDWVQSHEQSVRLVGGMILLIISWQIYRTPMPKEGKDEEKKKYVSDFFSALLLAFTNPLTILSFAAMYVGLGFGREISGHQWLASLFVAGIFIGSSLWWMLLSVGTSRLRERVTPTTLKWINRACGATIAVFGIVTLISYVTKLK